MPQGTLPSQYVEECRSCRQIRPGSASILLAVLGGGWRRRLASQGPAAKMAALPGVSPDPPLERQHPAGRVGGETPSYKQRPAARMAALPGVSPDPPLERQHPAGRVGGETPSYKQRPAARMAALPGVSPDPPLERQHPAGRVGGGGDAVLQAKVLPPGWRRSRGCRLIRPWERQHPAGRVGGEVETPTCKPTSCTQIHHLTY